MNPNNPYYHQMSDILRTAFSHNFYEKVNENQVWRQIWALRNYAIDPDVFYNTYDDIAIALDELLKEGSND
jgi:hypothetical protein